MTEKRFTDDGFEAIEEQSFTDNLTGKTYWIDNGLDEIVDLLNALHEENEQLKHDATVLIQANQDYRRENEQLKELIKKSVVERLLDNFEYNCKELAKENKQLKLLSDAVREELGLVNRDNTALEKENEQLVKMLNNVANYVQKEHREIPIDDFVEWWNNIATEGLE